MKADNEAVVSLQGFAKAGRAVIRRKVPKRAPQPTETFLYAEGETFVVDTPAATARLPMIGTWSARLVIDSRFFAGLCRKLGTGRRATLVYVAGRLFINGTSIAAAEIAGETGRKPKPMRSIKREPGSLPGNGDTRHTVSRPRRSSK